MQASLELQAPSDIGAQVADRLDANWFPPAWQWFAEPTEAVDA